MTDENIFTKNQLNFFRVCHLAANVLPSILRNIFVAEWNRKFCSQFGNWQNSAQNGQDFLSMETTKNKKRFKDILSVMADGDSSNWDCTKLFYAILYSSCIGNNLNQSVRKHVNDLREFRNESFAHASCGEVSACDFQKIVNKILQALLGLGQNTADVKKIQSQKSFSTVEVHELQEKLDREKLSQEFLEERLDNLEARLTILEFAERTVESTSHDLLSQRTPSTANPRPFMVLPAKPDHVVIQRENIDVACTLVCQLKAVNPDTVTAVYFAGGPGSGKTECARQLGGAVSRQISLTMTLNAKTFQDFIISLKELAEKLGFSDTSLIYFKQASESSQVEFLSLFIKEKLAGNLPSWLLIVDGLSKETGPLLEYLPKIGDKGNGVFLITTSDEAVLSENVSCSACIYLNSGLKTKESFHLLNSIAGPITQETAKAISEKLDHQPLFLASAANHVKAVSVNSGKSTEHAWQEILESCSNRYKEEELSYYLASLDKQARVNLETELERVLTRSAVYEEFCHLLLLAKGAALPLSFVLRMLAFQLNLSENVVEVLLRNCLLFVFTMKGPQETIQVNGIIYKLLTDLLAPSTREEPMLSRLRCLGHFALKNMHDSVVCSVFKLLTSEILRYLSLLDLSFPDYPEQRNLHHELGKAFLCVLVDYSSAVRCFTKALMIFERANDISQREYAMLLNSLGNVFRLTGNTDEACKYLNKSLKLLKSLCGTFTDEDIASCLSSLGLVYQSLGDLDRAGKLHTQALGIRQELHGNDDINTAASLNNIGGVYHESGDLATAKEYYWKALEIKGRNYGWDFPHVANSFNNIAEISHEQGDLCSALTIHKRSLKIRQRLYGDCHPDVANSLNNIAVIYHKQGELSSARKYHTKAVEIRKRVYGEEHTEVACSLSNLGQVYYDEGDLAAAEQCHTQALRIRQNHSSAVRHVISSLRHLMKVYLADQEITTAKEYAYEVFKIFHKTHGMNDPRTIHAFRRMTEISKREPQAARTFDFDTFEHVEKLSCL